MSWDINDYSPYPGQNTDINGIDLKDATSVPGDMNDALRQLAADLANTMWGDLSLIISDDNNNAVVMDSDNLLYVNAYNVKEGVPQDLISSNADNVLTTGTDGRPFCGSLATSYSYNDVTGKPNGFTPGRHAASHNRGGSDEVTFAIPSNQIWMWWGVAADVPTGWHICDGTNGTPDLRGRFIMGAASDAQVGLAGGGYSVKNSSVANKTIPLGYVPHTHSMVGWGPDSDSALLPGKKTPWAEFNYLSPTETSAKKNLVAGAHLDTHYIGPGENRSYRDTRYLADGVIYNTATEANAVLETSNTHSHSLENPSGMDSIYPPYKCLYYIMKA